MRSQLNHPSPIASAKNPGSSALEISSIALGGNIFGRFCDERLTADLLATARDVGINTVDTSDTYSDGESELLIGKAIKGARQHWFIATKAGIRSDESPLGLGRRQRIEKKVDASLRRLGVDCIDLYQMHHFDKGTPLEETLGTLEELRVMGKIRFAGASNYNGEQLATTLDVAHTQQLPPISSVQNHLNMLKRGGESDWLPLCVKSGVAVLVYGALARGILSGKYLSSRSVPVGSRASVSDSVRGDLAPEVLSTVDALSQLAEELGVKVEQLAVAWTLSRPGITSLILGVRTRDQIEDHVKALELRLGQAELARVDAVLGHVNRFDKYGLGAFIPR